MTIIQQLYQAIKVFVTSIRPGHEHYIESGPSYHEYVRRQRELGSLSITKGE